jgi:NTE family protein
MTTNPLASKPFASKPSGKRRTPTPAAEPAGQLAIAGALKPYKTIALALQGGGALGAYQAGVFEGLIEAGITPTWLSGVSIGAINAAIIAGNAPENRLARLRDFWDTIASSSAWDGWLDGTTLRGLRNQSSAFSAMTSGLPGFFKPRKVDLFALNPWASFFGAEEATSYYDTSELKDTLNRLIDWDILNDQTKRLSVGAVNIETGNFCYFDTKIERLTAEHIMASGALPPALPAITIGKAQYWDGGIVSNTPLQYLLELDDLNDTLAFQVDLFSARGALPRNMADVMSRQKDITYSSRTRASTDAFHKLHDLQMQLSHALARVPLAQLTDADRAFLAKRADVPQVNVIHLIYQKKSYEDHAKDYEFSARSMKEHWAAGLSDTRRTLKHPDWLAIPSEKIGMMVHDVHRQDPE